MKKILTTLLIACCVLSLKAQPFLELGLVAYYSFNGNANDLSGFNNHGTAYGVWPAVDHYGTSNQAYYFDGIASKVTVPKDKFVTDKLTVSFWIRIPSSSVFNFCMACSDFSIFTEADSVGMAIALPATKMVKGYAAIGTWTQVVGTFDNQTIRLYIDGAIADSVYHPGIIYDANWNLTMGSFGSNYWEGDLDEIRIYNRVLSTSEVGQLWASYGLEEYAGQTGIRSWPVPCNQTLNFEWQGACPEVSIFAADGRCVKVIEKPETSGSGAYSIPVNDLEQGVYWMQCTSQSQRRVEKILIGR